jgi:tetrahydromethanopterin S-methyltransferase subunit G
MSYGTTEDSSRISDLSTKVENVKGVMRDNLAKAVDRGERLDEVEQKADLLSQSANHFHKGAVGLRRKLWWQNVKVR